MVDNNCKLVLLDEAIHQRVHWNDVKLDDSFQIDVCIKCVKELVRCKISKRSFTSFDMGMLHQSLQSMKLTFTKRMFLATNMTKFHIFKVHNKGKRFSLANTNPRVLKEHCISFQHADTMGTLKKHILSHDLSNIPKLMIMCYIRPMSSLKESREMVHNMKQLIVRTEVIHKFSKEIACLNLRGITHDPTKFWDHVSNTIPIVIMAIIAWTKLHQDRQCYT